MHARLCPTRRTASEHRMKVVMQIVGAGNGAEGVEVAA